MSPRISFQPLPQPLKSASVGALTLCLAITACGPEPGGGTPDDVVARALVSRTSSALGGVPETCLQTYEHHDYGGRRWDFSCGGANASFSSWNDKITSFIHQFDRNSSLAPERNAESQEPIFVRLCAEPTNTQLASHLNSDIGFLGPDVDHKTGVLQKRFTPGTVLPR